jgi:hypothetical protein
MGVQKHNKKRFTKKIVSKSFYKKIDKKSKTDFFSILFYHVFGRFSVRGVQKHGKKNSQKNLTNPGSFLASEEPTNHPKARQSVCVPLGRCCFLPRSGLRIFFPQRRAVAPWRSSPGTYTGISRAEIQRRGLRQRIHAICQARTSRNDHSEIGTRYPARQSVALTHSGAPLQEKKAVIQVDTGKKIK